MLGGHTQVSKSVDDGEVEAWWECRTQHVGRTKARTWVENTWTAARARFRLEELTFGTFNIRTAAVNGVNGIGHINTLLRPCAAKGCDVVGLQETKRDGTSEIVASGYRVFFSGDCSGVKGRKGQHGVGLAIKEKVVKKACEDGIAIECISARLLKARISIKPYLVTFVVAYAPAEEAPERQKAKDMAALNSSVTSMPARKYFFVLTDANARTGKRGEGGEKADNKVFGCIWPRHAQRKRQTTAGFCRRQQTRSSEHFLLHSQKCRVLHILKRQPLQGTSTFELYPDKASGLSTHPLR